MHARREAAVRLLQVNREKFSETEKLCFRANYAGAKALAKLGASKLPGTLRDPAPGELAASLFRRLSTHREPDFESRVQGERPWVSCDRPVAIGVGPGFVEQ
jgi:hypothetical protein